MDGFFGKYSVVEAPKRTFVPGNSAVRARKRWKVLLEGMLLRKISFVKVSGVRSSFAPGVVPLRASENWVIMISSCCERVREWNLWYGSKFGWAITTSSFSPSSSARCQRAKDQIIGPKMRRSVPERAKIRCLFLMDFHLPSERKTEIPKRARFEAHTQTDPPSEPVTEYHCMREVVSAKELPSTSQGHEISAEVRYHLSQLIQAAASKR